MAILNALAAIVAAAQALTSTCDFISVQPSVSVVHWWAGCNAFRNRGGGTSTAPSRGWALHGDAGRHQRHRMQVVDNRLHPRPLVRLAFLRAARSNMCLSCRSLN